MVTYPNDWDVVELGSKCSITSSKRVFEREWKKTGIPFLRTRDIASFHSGEEQKDKLYISEETYQEKIASSGEPHKGDLLVTGVGTIGLPYLIDTDDRIYFKDGNILWMKKSEAFYPQWLYLQFLSKEIQKQITDGSGFTTVGTFTIKNAKKLNVPMPSVPEQVAVSETLSTFDIYIDDLAELIEKKRGIRDGALEDMMSGRIRLQGFTADWVVYPFSKYFSLLPTNTCSRDQLSDRGQVGDIHYGDVLIKYGDVLSDADEIPRLKDVLRIKERSFLKMHDVLIADTAEDETVGKAVQVGKVSIPLVGGLHTVACRPNYETAEGFLGYYMNSSQYHEQLYPYITGIKVSSISKKSFGETELCIPAEVEEQKAIVSVLKAIDEEIEALEIERDKMIQIREGAMDDLLTGRVRLSV